METARKATAEADRNSRVVSAFRFPPSLSAKHEEELRKRGISKEFALASGVRTAADNELRELNFQASLPHEERSKGLQGTCFPYVDLKLKAEAAWRIKPDTAFTMSDGSHPKYLSRVGDKVRAYFPHTTTLEMLSDPKANVVITEGEYKALAIAEALQKAEAKRKFAVIGLQGVNGGWHRDKYVVPAVNVFGAGKCWVGETFAWYPANHDLQIQFLTGMINVFVEYDVDFQILSYFSKCAEARAWQVEGLSLSNFS